MVPLLDLIKLLTFGLAWMIWFMFIGILILVGKSGVRKDDPRWRIPTWMLWGTIAGIFVYLDVWLLIPSMIRAFPSPRSAFLLVVHVGGFVVFSLFLYWRAYRTLRTESMPSSLFWFFWRSLYRNMASVGYHLLLGGVLVGIYFLLVYVPGGVFWTLMGCFAAVLAAVLATNLMSTYRYRQIRRSAVEEALSRLRMEMLEAIPIAVRGTLSAEGLDSEAINRGLRITSVRGFRSMMYRAVEEDPKVASYILQTAGLPPDNVRKLSQYSGERGLGEIVPSILKHNPQIIGEILQQNPEIMTPVIERIVSKIMTTLFEEEGSSEEEFEASSDWLEDEGSPELPNEEDDGLPDWLEGEFEEDDIPDWLLQFAQEGEDHGEED